MNKFAITLTVALSLLTIARADNLGFSGEIKGRKGCTIDVPDVIDLGRYSKNEIEKPGAMPGIGAFIEFKNCNQDELGEEISTIEFIGLPGEHDDINSFWWRNEGSAKGVALKISVQYKGWQERAISPYGGEYSIPIENDYSSIGVTGIIKKVGPITPGTIEVIMPFEIRYR